QRAGCGRVGLRRQADERVGAEHALGGILDELFRISVAVGAHGSVHALLVLPRATSTSATPSTAGLSSASISILFSVRNSTCSGPLSSCDGSAIRLRPRAPALTGATKRTASSPQLKAGWMRAGRMKTSSAVGAISAKLR